MDVVTVDVNVGRFDEALAYMDPRCPVLSMFL